MTASSIANIAIVLFLVAWGLFLISEASRVGGMAKPMCTASTTTDETKSMCHGYSAATVFNMFAAICSWVAAGFANKENIRTIVALLGLFWFGFANCAEQGTNSRVNCLSSGYQIECSGYGASSVFFSFAAVTIAVGIFLVKVGFEKKFQAIITFHVFLALSAVGFVATWSTQAKQYCDQSSSDSDTQKGYNAVCDGNAFAAFCAAMAMVAGVAFAALANKSRETSYYLWMGWATWFGIMLIGFTAHYGAYAAGYRYFSQTTTDYGKSYYTKMAEGFAAAAVFAIFGAIVSLVGVIFVAKERQADVLLTCGLAWGLFFLANACYLGGQSAADCQVANDAGTTDDTMKSSCGGYGAGTFFSICAWIIAMAAGVMAFKLGKQEPATEVEPPAPVGIKV